MDGFEHAACLYPPHHCPGITISAVITLLDQLDLKEYNWRQVSVILQVQLPIIPPAKFLDLFDETKSNKELSRIVSKFLMDQDRAGPLWVNHQIYVDLHTTFEDSV